jgi:hypothetical protein
MSVARHARRWIVCGAMAALIMTAVACSGTSPRTPSSSATPVSTFTPTQAPTQVPTPSPTPQPVSLTVGTPPADISAFSVGYDPVSQRLILQAGLSTASPTELIAQTWAWDGTEWSQLHPTPEPPPEVGGSMAVDPSSGHLMLAGGDSFSETVDTHGNNVPHWSVNNGTWLWDGATWTRVADNPRQGGYPALATDNATGQLLLNSPDIRGVMTTDDLEGSGPSWYGPGAYRWTGAAWVPVPHDASVSFMLESAAAYDPISRRLIQFGGTSQAPNDETQAFDGVGWHLLQPSTVPPAGPALAATDDSTGEIVMLTGSIDHPNLTATWTWNGSNWVRHILIEPPQDVVNGPRGQMLWDPAIHKIVLIGFGAANALHMWTWAGISYGWQQLPA